METTLRKPKRKAIGKSSKANKSLNLKTIPKKRPLKRKTVAGKIPRSNNIKKSTDMDQNDLVSDITEAKSIENSDNDISRIADQKEENLVNLIVKVLVRSTLEELYGKESN